MQGFSFFRSVRQLAAVLMLAVPVLAAAAPASPAEFAPLYGATVDRRTEVPPDEVQRYAALADAAFASAAIAPGAGQYVVLVDRDPLVQALMLLWRGAGGACELVGASPVSTGRPGSFDHFETPLGVFDLGWQRVPKGWGDGAVIEMRLQMHATDPAMLEPRLGTRQSKGCIRTPTRLNRLLEHHAVLDAEYDRLVAEGRKLWVLREDRDPAPGAGRYVIVVDSERSERPVWNPAPRSGL